MAPDKTQLDRLFLKFLEGTCTEEEEQLLWQWFFLLDTRSQEMIQSTEREMIAREEMRSVIMAQVRPAKKTVFPLRRYAAVAACLIGLVITISFLMRLSTPGKHTLLATVIYNDSSAVQSFYLPDSSRVMLNRFSSLSWEEDFATRQRRVQLKGEGYFEVHPDKQHPFIVESNGMETKALGTAFIIEAYDGETEMRVSLLHGKVAITNAGKTFQPALLEPGQLLRYRNQQKDIQIEKISVSNPMAWTEGGMTFNRIPLTEALNRLARHYHITIKYNADRLKQKTVSGSFNATSWEKLLPNILFVHDLTYAVQDSTINIQE